jgi:hypothetical protein
MRFLLTRSRSSSKGTTSQSTTSAFLASEFQALECTPVPVNIRQVTGDEKANLLASPAHHPHQHAIARRLTQSFSVFLS